MRLVNQPMPIWWGIMAGIELEQSRYWMNVAREDKKNKISPKQAVNISKISRQTYRKCYQNAARAMQSMQKMQKMQQWSDPYMIAINDSLATICIRALASLAAHEEAKHLPMSAHVWNNARRELMLAMAHAAERELAADSLPSLLQKQAE